MPRPLPSAEDASRILAVKRTRPTHRPPPTAGRPLAKFIKALDERFGKGSDGLKARWREIVGETLAARTEPVKVSKPRNGGDGVLELKVDGPAAALIQHQAPEILARVNLFLGADSVVKLRVVQGVIRRPAATQRPAEVAKTRRRRAQPLDAQVEAELETGLEKVTDDRLKTALRRLGREVLRR
jgi:hypothetical protein